ncbi:hypothetical protein HYN48_06860 [Flavobacterium magnum]|uniref:Uncharacterized protein n=1 Tax=Flavobacterium magnum TaxID=2162713 RepID=A0A2S0RF07_9FLAO|nr:hypothetical protein [Flavobacterium magnum]AWA29818.1 hypothetical protein HYN48_06860 [Flavobacterium magnum]
MKMIYNPFERLSTNSLLIAGILLTVAGGLLAWQFSAHYDGVLDLHFVAETQLQTPFIELLINIACLGLLLFLAAKKINPKTRQIDIICAVLVSRLPFYLMTPLNGGGRIYEATDRLQQMAVNNDIKSILPADMMLLAILGFVSLLFLVWFFALLWNGFKVACNAKGSRPVWYFIGTVIAAEVLSKILILYTL